MDNDLTSPLVTKLAVAVDSLRRNTPHGIIRRIFRRLDTDPSIEGWVLFFTFLSVLAFFFVPTRTPFGKLIVLVAILRLYEILVNALHATIFHGIVDKKKIAGYRRIVILLIANFVEVVFWFGYFYRWIPTQFTTSGVSFQLSMLSYSFSTATGVGNPPISAKSDWSVVVSFVESSLGLFMIVAVLAKFVSSLAPTQIPRQIEIAAISHFDPLCKDRLVHWLSALRDRQGKPPSFVAVEWDEQQFAEIRFQRLSVRMIAQERWPKASEGFITSLSESVAFEGDSHIGIFPETPTVWLDRGREIVDPTVITKYAPDRVAVYASYLERQNATANEASLPQMSLEAWNRLGERPPGGTDRDIAFSAAVSDAFEEEGGDWAIAIVGANHASDEPGYMRERLDRAGFHCIVTELSPQCYSAFSWRRPGMRRDL